MVKLEDLKIGDVVSHATRPISGTVTKKGSKFFAVDGGKCCQNPANWIREIYLQQMSLEKLRRTTTTTTTSLTEEEKRELPIVPEEEKRDLPIVPTYLYAKINALGLESDVTRYLMFRQLIRRFNDLDEEMKLKLKQKYDIVGLKLYQHLKRMQNSLLNLKGIQNAYLKTEIGKFDACTPKTSRDITSTKAWIMLVMRNLSKYVSIDEKASDLTDLMVWFPAYILFKTNMEIALHNREGSLQWLSISGHIDAFRYYNKISTGIYDLLRAYKIEIRSKKLHVGHTLKATVFNRPWYGICLQQNLKTTETPEFCSVTFQLFGIKKPGRFIWFTKKLNRDQVYDHLKKL